MLGENSRKILGFKGLIRKIFRNKDLACQRALKMALRQLRVAVLGDWHTSNYPNQVFIIAQGEVGVCDGRHRVDGMKKVEAEET
jgi:hypothetical protein